MWFFCQANPRESKEKLTKRYFTRAFRRIKCFSDLGRCLNNWAKGNSKLLNTSKFSMVLMGMQIYKPRDKTNGHGKTVFGQSNNMPVRSDIRNEFSMNSSKLFFFLALVLFPRKASPSDRYVENRILTRSDRVCQTVDNTTR